MTSRKNQIGISLCRVAFIFLLTIAPAIGFGQADARASAPLPLAAQEAVNKGIIAAKVPDYLLAIRYFEEARKIAPEAPVIYLNLGLAESKIAGRELRSIAWFGAYLAAYPDAPNAAAVKEQIAVLDVRNQSNVSRLIKTVENASDYEKKVPGLVGGFGQGGSLHDAAVLWARNGDLSAALQTAARIQTPHPRGWAQGAIGLELGMAGDKASASKAFALALRTSEHDGYGEKQSQTKMRVAQAQAQVGEIADALKTANSIQDAWASSWAKCQIADAQVEAGELAGARQTLATAIQTLDRLKDGPHENDKNDILREIALVQAKAGDLEAAIRTSELIQVDSWKGQVQKTIAAAQVKAEAESGDIASALQAANRISKAESSPLLTIIQAKAGDIAGAQKTTERLDGRDKGDAQRAIAMAQAKAGDFMGAQKTVDRIQNAYIKRYAQADIDKAQTHARIAPSPIPPQQWVVMNDDLLNAPIFLNSSESLKALSKGTPQETFEALRDMAGEMIDKSQVIRRMLKQQAQPPAKP